MTIARRQTSPSAPYAALTVWLFLALLVFYFGLTRGHFWSTDEIAVFQQARSLWQRGDLAIAPINNTVTGRGGKPYAPYGAGQSILALPLYGLGIMLHGTGMLAGPLVESGPDVRWGGEVEIFFVNLFNCLAIAGLVAVFFAFNLRLGVAPKWSLVSSLLLALTTHIAGFSTGFFQHGSEALCILWTFYFLFYDSKNPSPRSRALAGASAGIAAVVRVSTLSLLPVLTLYLLWNALNHTPRAPRRLARVLRYSAAFLIPVAAGIALQATINDAKFGTFSIQGSYARLVPFNTPLDESLYGFLFSPGESIFLFSPLLLLAPWYFRGFARRYRAETAAILGMALTYLIFYSKAYLWHGQWTFGPRYLVAMVPLLLLPLGTWLSTLRPVAWLGVGVAALFGAFVEVLAVTVNVSYVYHFEKYAQFMPPYGFIFEPRASQILTHWRALRAGDGRVDFWLLNVKRMFGIGQVLWFAVPLCALLAFCLWKVGRHLRDAEAAYASGVPVAFTAGISSELLRAAGLIWITVAVWIVLSH
jgi:hypothetical protein